MGSNSRALVAVWPADKTFLRALHVTNSDGVVNLSTLLHGHYGSRSSLRTTSMSWSMTALRAATAKSSWLRFPSTRSNYVYLVWRTPIL